MKKLQTVAAPVATPQSDLLDDVAVCLECSGETFNRLAALMQVLKDKAPKDSDAAVLADLGWTLACDAQVYAREALAQLNERGQS
ncbi:hypothetical protein [Zoogloea sp. LCSB751]|uniref:hypothetical protein n=1 Tax=Zoogloea sp. LCSB751 TaxID=1965277 RepID=UPI0009A4A11A|nr:hypothetical protein [Zoogloea sp. LCSB751]